MLAHAELDTLAIAHIDCDAFYAAIEKRDDPSLADKPVIVGGTVRGVVATACYIARTYGVHSAMPMFQALKACPDAVVIRPDMAKYAAVGRRVRAMMEALTPLVEPISIDEAFLDLTGTEKVHRASPAEVLVRFAVRLERELGITASIGLASNKFLAKLASDLDKPRGFTVIGRAEAAAFLAPKPVGLIWGVGRAAQEMLHADGYHTIGDLQKAEPAELARRYGSLGLRLARLSHGEDTRAVTPFSERKSVSAETTFDTDISDPRRLLQVVRMLSERVSARLKAAGIAGRNVTLKLKTADFRVRTRSRQLSDPTRLAERIFRTAADLLAREADGTPFRLAGVGVSDLVDGRLADPPDLVDAEAARRAAAEAAIDAVRSRYGRDSVAVGLMFDAEPRRRRPQAG